MQSPDELFLQDYLQTASLAADRAREVTRKWFRADLAVDSKADRTPVTIADRETEIVIRDTVLEHHPDHGFFGEETGRSRGTSTWQWVIDPIDGTKCFATGMPTFGTLISLLYENRPVIGIIDHPMLDERWVGVEGERTTHNGRPCTTRTTSTLEQASIYTTTMDMFDEVSGPQSEKLTRRCKFRVFGGDCYSYGLLASGFNDLVCEADLKPYDVSALIPVIQGAGGMITDWQGEILHLDSKGEVLASANRGLHRLAIDRLNP